MKGLLANNLGIKLISLLIALSLWFYVALVLDPQVEVRIHNVPVTMANFTDLKNKSLMITNEPLSVVDVTIRGNRSTISKISNKNVRAVLDLTGYAKVGEHDVPIQMDFLGYDVTIMRMSAESSAVIVDAQEKKNLPITVVTIGQPAEGFVAGNPTLSNYSVTIEGPRSTLSRIDKAEIVIELDGATGEISGRYPITLFSENGVENNEPELLTLNITEVTATVKVATSQ